MFKYVIHNGLKFFLLAIIVIALCIILSVFLFKRNISDEQNEFAPVSEKADISIGKVRHTSTRDGLKEWSLEAISAKFADTQKQVIFRELSIIFFMKNGEIVLTADNGILKTDSKDIEVNGNVAVKNEGYRLVAESLNYNHAKHKIFSIVPVKITGEFFNINADTMSFDLNTNKVLLKGKVKGMFSDNISF